MNNTINGSQEIWSAERVKELTMSRIITKSSTHEILQKQIRRPFTKTAVLLASAAAVICLMVLGSVFLFPQNNNAFQLKAYALEQQDDGSIEQREVDLVNDKQGWSFNDDGENVYINIWLKCDGENLKNVDFYVDDGFFAKQYIIRENGQILKDGVPMAGSGSTIMRYGNDYVNVGNHFTLNADEMTDDLLVFWGTESRRIGKDLNLPAELIVRAVATFKDGKTQEEALVIDLSQSERQGFGTVKLTDAETEQMKAAAIKFEQLVHSIPLEQCEVVPGSAIILTYGDTFEYAVRSDSKFSATAMWPITEESMNPANDRSLKRDGFPGMFDENGVMRFGSGIPYYDTLEEYDGSDGYIAVLETNGDGTFTGKIYRVPGWLILEHMK